MPKIELHRHLEGSVRLNTLMQIGKRYNLDVPLSSADALRPYVQMTADSPNDHTHFLSKFGTLRRFFLTQEIIQQIARECVEDAANDNIKYMELRFTPAALVQVGRFRYPDVIQWVARAVAEAQADYDIRVRLIVSLNRHESLIDGDLIVRAALENRHLGIVAIDLAGREAEYPAEPWRDLFLIARRDGLATTIHAGEWAGARNIRQAIEVMGCTRIGHGVRIIENHGVTKLARDAGVTFEVCITSNVQSGVVHAVEHHPIRDMVALQLRTTLNTDDPGISNVTLTDEYALAMDLGITLEQIKRMTLTAAESSFLPDASRAALIDYFRAALDDEVAVKPEFTL
jgi:adenosine deaminase